MAKAYTKEFLVDCFCFRYDEAGLNTKSMRTMADKFYDTVSREKFREYCGLDAQEVARYKKFCLENGINY